LLDGVAGEAISWLSSVEATTIEIAGTIARRAPLVVSVKRSPIFRGK
jgi:hypothetical protein